jgi:ribosomal protein L37AE/L43A
MGKRGGAELAPVCEKCKSREHVARWEHGAWWCLACWVGQVNWALGWMREMLDKSE